MSHGRLRPLALASGWALLFQAVDVIPSKAVKARIDLGGGNIASDPSWRRTPVFTAEDDRPYTEIIRRKRVDLFLLQACTRIWAALSSRVSMRKDQDGPSLVFDMNESQQSSWVTVAPESRETIANGTRPRPEPAHTRSMSFSGFIFCPTFKMSHGRSGLLALASGWALFFRGVVGKIRRRAASSQRSLSSLA